MRIPKFSGRTGLLLALGCGLAGFGCDALLYELVGSESSSNSGPDLIVERESLATIVGMAAASGGCLIAMDSGEGWSEFTAIPGLTFNDLAWDEGGRLFVLGEPGSLWWSDNGGELIYLDMEEYPNALAFDGSGKLWVVGSEGRVLTWDGGLSPPADFKVGEANINDVTRGSDGSIRMVDNEGRILRPDPAPGGAP